LDKLDESLAARQIAFLADLGTRLDSIPAAQLRQGDPTLGYGGSTLGANTAVEDACGRSASAPHPHRHAHRHPTRRRRRRRHRGRRRDPGFTG
jgi:hypothetical protein